MKTPLLLAFAIITLLSCTQAPKKIAKEHSFKLDSIADPNAFNGDYKAKVMVLGVFHFHNPGLDSYKPQFPFDILEQKRQEELDTLLHRIAQFKPTKILLEWNRIRSDSATNAKYQEYLNGDYDISEKSNEVFQIGFKLAKKMGHKTIYCSDAKAEWFGVELDWENYDSDAYLRSKDQYEKVKRYDHEPFYRYLDSLKTVQTLSEHLAILNEPSVSLKDHQAYLVAALEGAGDNYVGADGIANWYRRNLRIYSNAFDLTDFDKEERILMVYGAGHLWQLRRLFMESPDFDYVEANDYLIP